ncbi:hypothetical protein PMIN06_002321 [Paraphaeosphaeria minitans]
MHQRHITDYFVSRGQAYMRCVKNSLASTVHDVNISISLSSSSLRSYASWLYDQIHITAHHQQHPSSGKPGPWISNMPPHEGARASLPSISPYHSKIIRMCKQIYSEAATFLPKRDTIRKLLPRTIAYLY